MSAISPRVTMALWVNPADIILASGLLAVGRQKKKAGKKAKPKNRKQRVSILTAVWPKNHGKPDTGPKSYANP